MPKQVLNPQSLFDSQQYGFSQGVSAEGSRTIYLSGQVAWDANQQIVGPGDLGAQTRKSLDNLRLALAEAGAALEDVVCLRIYIRTEWLEASKPVSEALLASFPQGKAPASTWIGVPSLARPEFLIEIEAVAVC